MNIVGIAGTIAGLLLVFELGLFLPFNVRLESRSDRRARRIFSLFAVASILCAASLTQTVLDNSYAWSTLITGALFFAIYQLAKIISNKKTG